MAEASWRHDLYRLSLHIPYYGSTRKLHHVTLLSLRTKLPKRAQPLIASGLGAGSLVVPMIPTFVEFNYGTPLPTSQRADCVYNIVLSKPNFKNQQLILCSLRRSKAVKVIIRCDDDRVLLLAVNMQFYAKSLLIVCKSDLCVLNNSYKLFVLGAIPLQARFPWKKSPPL